MTRLLGFDPLQRATEFICRLMQCGACVGAQRPDYRWRLGLVCVGAQRPDVLEAGACVRRCPELCMYVYARTHVCANRLYRWRRVCVCMYVLVAAHSGYMNLADVTWHTNIEDFSQLLDCRDRYGKPRCSGVQTNLRVCMSGLMRPFTRVHGLCGFVCTIANCMCKVTVLVVGGELVMYVCHRSS